MINLSDQGFQELFVYLQSFNLHAVTSQEGLKSTLRSGYRRYHALLIWSAEIEKGAIWRSGSAKDVLFRSYFGEAVSDLCQSLLLYCQGLYKPAHLILRSAVENFVKAIGIAGDQNVLSLTSVFELLGLVGGVALLKQSKSAGLHYQNLRNKYAGLCKYVHTSDASYMSLKSVTGAFPAYDKKESKRFELVFRSIIISICVIMCVLFTKRLHKMHHSHADYILDILPKAVKADLIASG